MKFLNKISDNVSKKVSDMVGEKIDDKLLSSDDKIEKLSKKIEDMYQNDASPFDIVDCCCDLLSIDPFNKLAKEMKVYAYRMNKIYDLAEKECSNLLKEYPYDDFLLEQMGLILYQSENYIDSIPYFEKLIQKIPSSEDLALDSKRNKATALVNSYCYDEAIEFCDKELKLHRNDESLILIKNEAVKKNYEYKENLKLEKKAIERKEEESEPIKILKMRYAKGEISKEEFEQMKKDLE